MSAADRIRTRRADAPTLARLRRVATSTRRGAAFLWFLLLALPLMTVGLTLAVDIARIHVKSKEVHAAVDASALAGAQRLTGAGFVDRADARLAVTNTLIANDTQGTMPSVTLTGHSTAFAPNSTRAEAVTVTVDYRIDGLIFMPVMVALLDPDQRGDFSSIDASTTRTAWVCRPGQAGVTGGFCQRPFTTP